jgi:hypothetical protein
MHTNRLAHEKSPYLLQHAHNPVDWYPWGEEAFEKARAEDKPIFLSAGYSTCHWCHVMERESFESEEIAAVLNRFFVPVKLDREERPDIDRIYMLFVQATTGSGGWPMSVWLTPDLKPFFGGTYFPPDSRYGRPGFRSILERIAEAWMQDRERLVRSGTDILRELEKHSTVAPESSYLDATVLDSGFFVFRRSFDPRHAGFGGAPKFPRPVVHNFLLREYARTRNQEALDMVVATLKAMARGGMNDQLGGGFHRYSVDERWFVPHFEKMLYDQAQLAVSYLEAYQISEDESLAGVARDILEYVLRDMTDSEGGFYSAEDADSIVDPARPHEKAEGAFYLWTQAEIEALLGQPAAEWFCYRYGVEPNGNVREDAHGEFAGKNILYEQRTAEETAQRFGCSPEEIEAAMMASKWTLLAARSGRIRPHLDDKILTAWNGLMISAFALAAQALDEPSYLDAARRAANFILGRMYNPESGVLLRRYRGGEAAIAGFLDDYAFFIQALLDLYETDFDVRWRETAVALADKARAMFEDPARGAYFSTADNDPRLVLRMKDDYDGAEPSGNSVMALSLLRLAEFTGRPDFREPAVKTLRAFASRLKSMAAGVPQMLVALNFSLAKPKQIILAGDRDAAETRALLRELRRRFVPNKVVLLDSHRERLGGRATAYVCENFVCKLPVTEPSRLAALLE